MQLRAQLHVPAALSLEKSSRSIRNMRMIGPQSRYEPFGEKISSCKKVKWSRYRPGVAQRVGRGVALLFQDRGIRRGWVVSITLRPHFTPGKDPVPILQEAGWAPGLVWTGGKSHPHRDSIPDHPAHWSVAIPTELPGPQISSCGCWNSSPGICWLPYWKWPATGRYSSAVFIVKLHCCNIHINVILRFTSLSDKWFQLSGQTYIRAMRPVHFFILLSLPPDIPFLSLCSPFLSDTNFRTHTKQKTK
jgi:hypothetical protein